MSDIKDFKSAIGFTVIPSSTSCYRSGDSSVSIVSDYGLDNRAIGVLTPARAKDFSSNLCVQTGSGAKPASCAMGNEGPFPRAKGSRGVTLTTHPHLVPRLRISRSYILSLPTSAFMACSGTALFLLQDTVCIWLQQYSVNGKQFYSQANNLAALSKLKPLNLSGS
jgi:hypothetical protein